jgi:hypothetical protein
MKELLIVKAIESESLMEQGKVTNMYFVFLRNYVYSIPKMYTLRMLLTHDRTSWSSGKHSCFVFGRFRFKCRLGDRLS